MLGFRHHYTNYITSGANLVLLWIGAEMGSREGWIFSLLLVALTSFIAWFGNIRRQRAISSIATSNIASAAQGYAELFGRAVQQSHDWLSARLSGRRCVWFYYKAERRTGNDERWETLDEGSSDDTILLDDGSGQCTVDADGAEVYTTHRKSWRDGEYRYTEWLLLPNEPLYVIGEFSTIQGGTGALERNQEVSALLAEWKRDHKELLRRFDANRDGQIDMAEWEAARQAAHAEVDAINAEIRLRDGFHLMKKPRDGRFFLISNLPPEKFARRYLIWSWYHLVMIFISGGYAGYLLG